MIARKDCSSSSSSSSSQQWTYHVFLSFRGKDTRNNFIAHLHDALCRKRINTYIDNHLRIGEEISEALFKAIEDSSIAIIILSKNYAESSWCLNELIKILECKEKKHQLVIPIFYNVEPSEVRNQTGRVGKAFAKLEARFKDDMKLERWKRALKNVANLSGFHLGNRNESMFMQEIIQELEPRIVNQGYFDIPKYPVGIESRVPQVISLPKVGLKDQLSPWRLLPDSAGRICAGCNTEIGFGRFLNCMGDNWHPACFRCHACNQQIIDYEFSISGIRPYHKSCYVALYHPRCDVCKNFIPQNSEGLIEYRAHPFWGQKYCPAHEHDGTPQCYSCERMEPRDMRYLILDDGREQCLECRDSAIKNTHECQPLYLEIQEYYKGLNMEVQQQIPMLLVERQVLNEATEGRKKNGHNHSPETRGLCLSEEKTITTISKMRRIFGDRLIDIVTRPYGLTRRCEVTAILVLYGLPRLLTGSILAHEMMHAWLRLKGYNNLRPEVEEGICQVLAHMWLDSTIYPTSGSNVASSSSPFPSSSSPSSSTSSKGKYSDSFEKKLGAFYQYQIKSDTSYIYGDGLRLGNQAVLKYGLSATLDHIRMTGSFPD